MKAHLTSRFKTDRIDLASSIPLSTPLVVFLDPSSACNFRCKFCFHGNPESSHSFMTKETFDRCVSDLSDFPGKLKVVHFYAFGEPTLHPRFAEMLAELKKTGVSERVDFTTNGSRLNPGFNRKLIDSSVDKIIISVGGLSSEDFFTTCRAKINFDEYVKNISDLYDNRNKCTIHIKTSNGNIPNTRKKKFFDIFGDMCDEIFYENIVDIWGDSKTDISPQTAGIYQNSISNNKICPYIFYQMTIHSDGNVSSCFIDWNKANVIGNVNTDHLVNIWNGHPLRLLRMEHLFDTRKGICVNCGQMKYGSPDNLDPYKNEILRRMP